MKKQTTAKRRQRKNDNMVALYVRLDPKIMKGLRAISERENLSLAAVVARILASVQTV